MQTLIWASLLGHLILGFSHLRTPLCFSWLQQNDWDLAVVMVTTVDGNSFGALGEGRLTLQLSGRPCAGLVARLLLGGRGGVGAGFAGASPSKTRDHAGAPTVQGP